MNYINIHGDENAIIQELSKYMSQGGAKIIVQNLSSYIDVLDDDETFDVKEEKQEQENRLGFMVPKTNYYLNVKKTTIALIGLLFDIQVHGRLCFFCIRHFWDYGRYYSKGVGNRKMCFAFN